jgi:hypothetical protein
MIWFATCPFTPKDAALSTQLDRGTSPPAGDTLGGLLLMIVGKCSSLDQVYVDTSRIHIILGGASS